MTRYTCKICGARVERTGDGAFVRKCGCTDAPILAHLTATAASRDKLVRPTLKGLYTIFN